MNGQFEHEILPQALHDELARQNFVQSLKVHLAGKICPGTKVVYEKRLKPAFERQHKRTPRDRSDVRQMMASDPYYQMWSALQRTSQEMMWDAVSTSVERQLEELARKAVELNRELGSPTLDPTLPLPPYHAAVDIHCQPGGYHTELRAGDIAAGAIYDRAVFVYAMGRMGALNDDMGASVVAYLKQQYRGFRPARILDMGCSVGHSTLPYVDAYPEAEVCAIDVAAPMLRYAHARATSLGRRVHFSQQNAESTNFPDESFDLIVSHILLHETSAQAVRNIMRECHRLLRKGAMAIHAEVPQYAGMDPYDSFMLDWDTYNNNEPFWGYLHDMDLRQLAVESGFDGAAVVQTMVPSAFEQAKTRTRLLQGGDFAGAGQWFLYIASK
jgi:ubiquinone/menaquinone biosynthesis C-methylase UbiE